MTTRPPRVLSHVDAPSFLRWAAAARSAFGTARAEIDALNVFPVPDGDTGTNLYLTLDAALDRARSTLERQVAPGDFAPLVRMCQEMSRAMLLTARGNSGVILSQLFRGFADQVVSDDAARLDSASLAAALVRADELAWQAVTEPKEGTILSVSRATSQACEQRQHADPTVSLADLVTLAVQTATAALAKTPDQLPVLARAGVVDAGGAGYLLLLEALQRVVHGLAPTIDDPMERRPGWARPHPPVQARPAVDGPADADVDGTGPAFEVMYLLDETDEARVESLRSKLATLGDSLLVVGSEGTWNVHVHVDDPGAAVEAGVEAGRPHRIVISHFGDQISDRIDEEVIAVVACAAGDGIAEVFRVAGTVTVMSGPGQRASAGQLLDAIRTTHAGQVIVLPNDADTEMAAQAAARAAETTGLRVEVVRSRTAVQGIAALAVFDHEAELSTNVAAMAAAAEATRHGAVTIAHKQALTAAGWCHIGDVLGAVDGEFVIIGSDLYEVAGEVVEQLLGDDGELLTVVSGADAPPDLASAVAAAARIRRRDLEVTFIQGHQPLYPLLLGVE